MVHEGEYVVVPEMLATTPESGRPKVVVDVVPVDAVVVESLERWNLLRVAVLKKSISQADLGMPFLVRQVLFGWNAWNP